MSQECIMATKMQAEPKDMTEKIIKDADTSHLAKDYFEETSEFLTAGIKASEDQKFWHQEWIEQNIELFTKAASILYAICQENWKEQKKKNLFDLLKKEKKIKKETCQRRDKSTT